MMRQLSWWLLVDSLHGAVRVTCIVITILVAATFMSSAMGYLHVPQQIAQAMAALDLGPLALIAVIGAFYLLLGLFLEGPSILVMSLPITLPLIIAAGYDPIWFGVFLVGTVELAQVTPPIGFNLFVLQGLTGESIGHIALAALPFFLLLLSTAVIITLFPGIALWLPGVLYDL
jgi:C4-dicarboxylate transporter, DctM subunit